MPNRLKELNCKIESSGSPDHSCTIWHE